MLAAEFSADYFTQLGLPRQQALDEVLFEARFREIQMQVHPDRHTQGTEADRRLAMQWATRLNEAFVTLKSPVTRARYLLGLLGHDPEVESNTSMPMDFLVDQMELRELVAEARVQNDEEALEEARLNLLSTIRAEYAQLEVLIDQRKQYAEAAQCVRQLMFQEKLLDEIDEALEAVLA